MGHVYRRGTEGTEGMTGLTWPSAASLTRIFMRAVALGCLAPAQVVNGLERQPLAIFVIQAVEMLDP
jgi:hypothetical protein